MSVQKSPTHTVLLVTLGLGVFAGALDLGVLSPALPALARTFSVAKADLAWVFSLYLLVNIIGIAVASTLADRHGRRTIYLACIGLFAVGSLVTIFSQSYDMFLLGRALQALGAGGIFPVAAATIGDVVPLERRGAALGLVAATWGLAAIIGPLVGGFVTHFVSWRWIFVANIPLAIVVASLARTNVPSIAPRVRGPLDVTGLVLLCAGLLSLVIGIINLRIFPPILGVALLGAFVWRQRSIAHPIIPPKLFQTPQLAKTYGLELLIGILEGSLFFIPTVLVDAQNMTAMAAGAIAALGAVTFVAVIPASGRALDRVGSRTVLIVGTLFTEIGLATFALGFTSLPMTILSMIVAGLGFGALLGAPTRYIITNATTERTRASAIGLLSQFLIIGQLLGSAMAGGIVAAASSDLAGYKAAYLAFCAVALLALAVATMLQGRDREREADREAEAA
ncbi:MAG: MFS transporter [Vulcanimicrobiaceae bacterium]